MRCDALVRRSRTAGRTGSGRRCAGPGDGAHARPGGAPCRGSSSLSRLALIVRQASRSSSTNVAVAAPRLSASSPSAPEPAKRSSTSASSTGPIRLNAFSRTRSEVGRVSSPFGAAIRRPRWVPAMILTRRARLLRRGGPPRPATGRPRRAARAAISRARSIRSRSTRSFVNAGRSSPTAACRAAGLRGAGRDRPAASSKPSVVSTSACSRASAVSVSSSTWPRDEQAVALLGAAPDTAAQLVQLREPEAVGLLHDHDRRVRNVDADLDHRRRDEHVELAAP